MKIIRATIAVSSETHVYANDERDGKAIVTAFRFSEYIKALEIVARFESDVNKQYERNDA